MTKAAMPLLPMQGQAEGFWLMSVLKNSRRADVVRFASDSEHPFAI
jgi:hypothetical protein